MQSYETIVIFNTKLSDEEYTQELKKVEELISSNGKLVSTDDWKTRKLAYEIKHEAEGHYVLFNFECNPKFIAEFERLLRINANVLKHMVVRK